MRTIVDLTGNAARQFHVQRKHMASRRICAPLRMYDDACPVSHSQIAFRKLRSRGVPCEMVLYPGEFHGWRRPANQLDGDQRVLAWFMKWLMIQPKKFNESPRKCEANVFRVMEGYLSTRERAVGHCVRFYLYRGAGIRVGLAAAR